MRTDDSNWQPLSADASLPDVSAARAQVVAARLRQERLIAAGQLSSPVSDGAVPHRTLPGYTLVHELHRGGQGVVFLAMQESTGRQVAIKFLRGGPRASSGAGLARFEREVEILSRLKHRNIVTVHDCGRDHQDVYLVMDYVEGCPLDAYVVRDQPPIDETLSLFAKICDGVNAAHLRGVIHRDLKPGNILIDEHDEPHVLDFGLAKLVDDADDASSAPAMTITGQFVGSLPWASPEQAEGRSDQLDIRTDVYSLGVVLYQILTGQFPYPVSGRLNEVVRHIVQTDPIRPSTVQRDIDSDLETILLKCLAKEPERRYQSAGDLARDIRRYLTGEAIEARRDSLVYLTRRILARHRVAVIAATVVLIAILSALVVSFTFWRQAEKQRVIAQHNAADAQASAQRADREAEQARAVNDFMRSVLTSVEPEKQGADVRLLDVLATASKTASQRFAAHPQQEAQLRELIGQLYFDLSMWREAQAEYDAALALWRQDVGADDPRTLKAESTCAGVALNLSKYREAETALTALLPRMARLLGPDDRNTLAARRSLAIALLHQGRPAEAEPILLELRAHPALADDDAMQLRLAQTLIDLLQWKRAPLPNGPERSASLAQEEALAREWIERATRHNGPDAANTLQARVILSEIAHDQGKYQETIDECRDVLKRTSGKLPECHDVRAWAMAVLANALGRLDQIEEPADLYLRRIECLRQHGPPARISLLSAMSDAMGFLDRAGRSAQGESLARELSDAMKKFGGNMSFASDLFVARFVSMQNRLDEAETLFQPLLAREEQLTDTRMRARLHLFYGGQLARRGSFTQAEEQLIAAVGLTGDIRSGTQLTHPDDLIVGHIALYDAWGKSDEAQKYRQMRQDFVATPQDGSWGESEAIEQSSPRGAHMDR